ncbi:hypothetical protein GYH30_027499 [Glycine max]|nr:hypothetical protein GYH30_027499 [Glycine max]
MNSISSSSIPLLSPSSFDSTPIFGSFSAKEQGHCKGSSQTQPSSSVYPSLSPLTQPPSYRPPLLPLKTTTTMKSPTPSGS